jgi:hypothetical protein
MADTPKEIKVKVRVSDERIVQHLRMMAENSRKMAEGFDEWADGIESGKPGWSRRSDG